LLLLFVNRRFNVLFWLFFCSSLLFGIKATAICNFQIIEMEYTWCSLLCLHTIIFIFLILNDTLISKCISQQHWWQIVDYLTFTDFTWRLFFTLLSLICFIYLGIKFRSVWWHASGWLTYTCRQGGVRFYFTNIFMRWGLGWVIEIGKHCIESCRGSCIWGDQWVTWLPLQFVTIRLIVSRTSFLCLDTFVL